jgi:hypothetical protein
VEQRTATAYHIPWITNFRVCLGIYDDIDDLDVVFELEFFCRFQLPAISDSRVGHLLATFELLPHFEHSCVRPHVFGALDDLASLAP